MLTRTVHIISILALLLILVQPVALAGAQTEVPKWSVYEINLTAAVNYDNPYTAAEAVVTAIFTGPGGISKTVAGFWDSDNSFKIRFSPTVEGTWVYQTKSADAGLNGKTGKLTCATPAPGNHGFLRVDKAHPYSFVWDDGFRYFMWGQTYYDWIQPAQVNDNWKVSVDNSLKYGMNKIRMHVYGQKFYTCNVEFNNYPDAQPHPGDSKNPDRDRLNLPYWRKLDEMVRHMQDKGMVADLIIFNPYDANRAFGVGEQNDRFVRYVVARYAAYSNVIWCICNEWDLSPRYKGVHVQEKADFERMGKIVRRTDPWAVDDAQLRALSIHPGGSEGPIGARFAFLGSDWPSYACLQYGGWNPKFDEGDRWGNAGIVDNLRHKMPVVNDEYGYFGQHNPPLRIRVDMDRTRLRNCIWGIATAGGYGSAGDFRITPDGMGNVEITGDWYDDPEEYGDLKRMIDFFTTKGIEYWKMSSRNELVSSGERSYVLAEPGRQYVIYAATGGTIAVSLAPGSYRARRHNPRTGEESDLGAIAGGTSRSFTMPDANDWVLWLSSAR
jgi:hypothetical protein